MEWLTKGWDQGHWVAATVGLAVGVALAVLGFAGLAEVGAVLVALVTRWGLWQIPPAGRSKAQGPPSDFASRLGQLAVVVLLVTLVIEIVTSPLHS